MLKKRDDSQIFNNWYSMGTWTNQNGNWKGWSLTASIQPIYQMNTYDLYLQKHIFKQHHPVIYVNSKQWEFQENKGTISPLLHTLNYTCYMKIVKDRLKGFVCENILDENRLYLNLRLFCTFPKNMEVQRCYISHLLVTL